MGVGGSWHTDQSFRDRPVMATALIAREVPGSGGDTLFANMTKAYDALSDGLKKTLASLNAFHKLPGRQVQTRKEGTVYEGTVEEATHPVVTAHPETGRRILYVNPHYTVRFEGWTEEESTRLLHYPLPPCTASRGPVPLPLAQGLDCPVGQRQTWHLALMITARSLA